HTKRGSRRYRYYTCTNAQRRGWHACPSRSIPAAEMDKVVVGQIRAACPVATPADSQPELDGPARFDPWWQALAREEQGEALERLVETADSAARSGQVAIPFRPGGFDPLTEAAPEVAAIVEEVPA